MPKLHRDVCARNYLHFITRCGRSSCRWKLQDLGVNPGFKPCVRYIIHLRKQRTFFNTVLSVANFTWPSLGMLYRRN
ncbi:hypothetical protein ISN45_At01g015350 [Arabidopsis thaliana x Arabidopsis arenosa]|uniref:Uncharacterized protein n=1 Tax=Arabidopsis thaliana x Arabidopsis arenosa TaxID=1240361 RepID=A0A8T2GGD6_9BRAS|nr:hypothetical protein ISN45_At01g015350 [Arabidopsis thaliana x Arabidopsis arenosa]KAG7646391.1 hypothetical protein ISN45_At01g015350 [Arabidopsis thaliana x Arabidopsis arenosa]